MSAVVTDQFRIANATNFVESVLNDANSYYVFWDCQILQLLDLVELMLLPEQ